MAIPKYYEMYKPILEALKDGYPHSIKELKSLAVSHFHLRDEELTEMLPSGRQPVFLNRMAWARTYLKKAGLIDSPTRGIFVITPTGQEVLKENLLVIDNDYLMKFEGFRELQKSSFSSAKEKTGEKDTPDDLFEESFKKINETLMDDILSEVMKLSPSAFEQLVIDLLSKMGYGAFENAGRITKATGDEGIDGVIMEDKLGFSLIYIQAKKWDLDSSVGRLVVQSFVGAISGKGGKGLFVTTAKFTKQATDYANQQHIILIDGKKLAKLMIEHNFGVSVKKIFEIKTVDTDAFNEYDE